MSLADLARRINIAHETVVASSIEHAVEAGKLLLEAKAQVPHGEWMKWLKANCKVSGRTARLYMQIANDPSRMATVANLTLRAAARPRDNGKARSKTKSADSDAAAAQLDAGWAGSSMQAKADFIKKNLRMVKSLVKRVESADEVSRQRG